MPTTLRTHTALGFAALLLWSSTVAVGRTLSETVGALTSAALAYGAGGILGCVLLAVRGGLRPALALPKAHLLGAGGLFVAYTACLYLALGRASDRWQAVEVGILNYLWPALTLLGSILLLGTRARLALLLPGLLLGFAGAALAPLRLDDWSPGALLDRLRANPGPYLLGLAAAVLWALYSNVSRRTAGGRSGGAVPLFVLATGVVLGALRLLFPEASRFSPQAILELSFVAVLPTLLAYVLWDAAVRHGDLPLLAALSCLTPLLSTGIAVIWLRVPVGPTLWLACFLVVTGAGLCAVSVRRPTGP
jgi:drug/metabolite transporter (DMT)-like permease